MPEKEWMEAAWNLGYIYAKDEKDWGAEGGKQAGESPAQRAEPTHRDVGGPRQTRHWHAILTAAEIRTSRTGHVLILCRPPMGALCLSLNVLALTSPHASLALYLRPTYMYCRAVIHVLRHLSQCQRYFSASKRQVPGGGAK